MIHDNSFVWYGASGLKYLVNKMINHVYTVFLMEYGENKYQISEVFPFLTNEIYPECLQSLQKWHQTTCFLKWYQIEYRNRDYFYVNKYRMSKNCFIIYTIPLKSRKIRQKIHRFTYDVLHVLVIAQKHSLESYTRSWP